MKKILILAVVVVTALLVWRYLGQTSYTKTSGTTETTQISGTKIEIKNSAFEPNSLTVKAGEKITVVNTDFTGHSVTADDGSFDTGIIGKDKSAIITAPSSPGIYKFHCLVHSTTMMGTLVVK